MISIVTATYNASSTICTCVESIRWQSIMVPVEHIIVDGKSTDETVAIVKGYESVNKLISEPDSGIYDAMNKGVRFSGGRIIGILNADDFYADSQVLERVAQVFDDETVDACYGDLDYVDAADISRVVRRWRSGTYNLKSFYWGWMPPHPTFFVRRRIYERYGLFNLSLGSAADYELMLRFLLKHHIKAVYIPHVLVKMRTGGVSNASFRNRIRANQMDRMAWRVNDLHPYPWTTLLKPLRKIHQYA